MANVDEVLATMDTPEEAEKVILVIDEDLRVVTIPGIALVIGAEGDKDVNRLWFKMNRMYRGTDLSGFTPRVNYNNAAGKPYFYVSPDMTVEGDSLLFSWLIGRSAAEEKGTVEFSVCMQLLQDGGVVKEFNTTTATMQCLRSIHEADALNDASDAANIVTLGHTELGTSILGGTE